jgi:hypothetical protein
VPVDHRSLDEACRSRLSLSLVGSGSGSAEHQREEGITKHGARAARAVAALAQVAAPAARGWVDQGGMNLPNRFEEQLWLTLFAKAPEITIFNIGAIYSPGKNPDGSPARDSRAAALAGPVFERVDRFLGKLGRPVGLKTYRPYHSSGEDHLPSYLGMIGIPTMW